MKPLILENITSDALRRGDYKKELPEYYTLVKHQEHSAWHTDKTIFDQVIRVFEQVETLSNNLSYLPSKVQYNFQSYLSRKIGLNSRLSLLKAVAILHDIGKSQTVITLNDGDNKCPEHEIVAYLLFDQFKHRFKWDEKDSKAVKNMILCHGMTHEAIGAYDLAGGKRLVKTLKKFTSESFPGLLFFAYADMKGSDLPKLNSSEFQKREKTIISLIEQQFRT